MKSMGTWPTFQKYQNIYFVYFSIKDSELITRCIPNFQRNTKYKKTNVFWL